MLTTIGCKENKGDYNGERVVIGTTLWPGKSKIFCDFIIQWSDYRLFGIILNAKRDQYIYLVWTLHNVHMEQSIT